jgi:transcriptional regulator with XRE-family HTH domain
MYRHRLVNADLLRQLMQRTGTGSRISIRDLADAAGVPHGTIGNLLTGEQYTVPADKAAAIARVIGVDVLILFEPLGRSTGGEFTPTLRSVSA